MTGTDGTGRPVRGTDRRGINDTVDFLEFKDDEKNVVETMLESNKGLRMAEINFHDLKLSKIIGAGAFGEVIKGTYCGTPVVVKRMLRNKITEDNLRMFGEEIQLMMNLRHPNIVQVRSLLCVTRSANACVDEGSAVCTHMFSHTLLIVPLARSRPRSSLAQVGTRTPTCTTTCLSSLLLLLQSVCLVLVHRATHAVLCVSCMHDTAAMP